MATRQAVMWRSIRRVWPGPNAGYMIALIGEPPGGNRATVARKLH
jgi:hypothetical protein